MTGIPYISYVVLCSSMNPCRGVDRFSNPGGGQAVMWWALSAPLVGIGLTELPKSRGWGMKPPPDPPLATPLSSTSFVVPILLLGTRFRFAPRNNLPQPNS